MPFVPKGLINPNYEQHLITMKTSLLALVLVIQSVTVFAQNDVNDVQEVILSAYVNGIHNGGPIEDIESGFHPEFMMYRQNGNEIGKTSISEWLDSIKRGRENNPNPPAVPMTATFIETTVSGTSANVVLELRRGERLIFTDHMLLYKFENDWKIVAKTFYRHP